MHSLKQLNYTLKRLFEIKIDWNAKLIECKQMAEESARDFAVRLNTLVTRSRQTGRKADKQALAFFKKNTRKDLSARLELQRPNSSNSKQRQKKLKIDIQETIVSYLLKTNFFHVKFESNSLKMPISINTTKLD
jgi:dsDNA-binding SOS-regulon protein